MLKCKNCGRVNACPDKASNPSGRTGYCESCSHYLGGRLCLRAGCGYVNSLEANCCRMCGSAKLSLGAACSSLGYVASMILAAVAGIVIAVLWFSGAITAAFHVGQTAVSSVVLWVRGVVNFFLACCILGLVASMIWGVPIRDIFGGVLGLIRAVLVALIGMMPRLFGKK